MFSFSKSFVTIIAFFALFILAPSVSYGQNSKPQPTPTPAPGPSDVNVVNTPTVTLAPGVTVGINPASNTVKLDTTAPVTVRGEETVLAYDETKSVDSDGVRDFGPIDVSAFKQIRVVVSNAGGHAGYSAFTRLLMDNDSLGAGVVFLDNSAFVNSSGYGTRVYELPGDKVDVRIVGGTFSSTVRVQVYGRK